MALTKRQRNTLLALKEAYISGNPEVVEAELVVEEDGVRRVGYIPEVETPDGMEPSAYAIKLLNEMFKQGEDTSKIEKLLGIPPELPEELEKELEKFGTTPMDEKLKESPSFYEAREFVSKRVKLDEYLPEIIAAFTNAVTERIWGLTDKDGNLKRTELVGKMGMVKKDEGEKITAEIGGVLSGNIDEQVKAQKNILKIISKRIPMKGVSEWEKGLLANHAIAQVSQDVATYVSVFR